LDLYQLKIHQVDKFWSYDPQKQ